MNERELEQSVAALSDWFHSIDLGDGVITPGRKTPAMLEAELASLHLPDLAGKSVLDIGAYDGFYTFAAEKRGASRVVALDHFVWSLDLAKLRELGDVPFDEIERCAAWDPKELPGKRRFDLAHRALGSRAEAVVADFHDVDFEAIGGPFDVVLFLGVLYHMRAPLTSLESVARATRGVAIIETEAMEISRSGGRAVCEFIEGAELNGDPTNWWIPNEKALLGMCRAAGFARAEMVRDAGSRLQHLAAARRAHLSAGQIARAGVRRLREELAGVRRHRAIVHAWK
jgi:tRNA (mo5U34)-methyltransferase